MQATVQYLDMAGRAAQGQRAAQASIYQQLQQQASAMSYADIYMALCWMSCGMVILAFLLNSNRPGDAPKGVAAH